MVKRRRFTLMPLIALMALSLMASVPALSSMHLYAATATRYATVMVRPGDTLWAIASTYSRPNTDIQAMIDRISEVNHLQSASLQPGQRLRVPL